LVVSIIQYGPAYNTAEQIWQPSDCGWDGTACIVVYLAPLDFQKLRLGSSWNKSHIRRPVPFLLCGVVGLNSKKLELLFRQFFVIMKFRIWLMFPMITGQTQAFFAW